ncbi:lipid II flippase family protein [Paraburkholderia caledonica]|uniref:lipid II flippase family protein n=1 Tax=Paraburkholderia caledonica TaxID=134536 RepID=UPI003709B34C
MRIAAWCRWFVRPKATQVSVKTDDVVEGQTSENSFRRTIVTFAGARVLWTVCAQIVLVPTALIIVRFAELT